ncbi:MAG: MBOAT family protein, partial [Allomuricauda sp.]
MKANRKYLVENLGEGGSISIKEVLGVISTFSIVTLSWIFFRAESLKDALEYVFRLFSNFSFQTYIHPLGYRMIDYYILLALFVCYEYIIKKDERNPFKFKSSLIRITAYTLIIFGIILFYDSGVDRSFIYFQF